VSQRNILGIPKSAVDEEDVSVGDDGDMMVNEFPIGVEVVSPDTVVIDRLLVGDKTRG